MNASTNAVSVRISPTIWNEYQSRCPEFAGVDKVQGAGVVDLTIDEARAVLSDAEFNSDRKAFDVGEYGMPLGIFNAYRALAKQLRAALPR